MNTNEGIEAYKRQRNINIIMRLISENRRNINNYKKNIENLNTSLNNKGYQNDKMPLKEGLTSEEFKTNTYNVGNTFA